MSDAVTLTVPHARSYYGVVRLVVGGLAARLDLSYDALDDVQVALDTLLATEAYAAGPDVTVEIGDRRTESSSSPSGRSTGQRSTASSTTVAETTGSGSHGSCRRSPKASRSIGATAATGCASASASPRRKAEA